MSQPHGPRLNYGAVAPEAYGQLIKVTQQVHASGLEAGLLDLIEVRASQINGCAFCIDMHSKSAKLHGERELRLYALPAWRESPLFSERERAALAWTEAVTLVSETGVGDAVYEQVRAQFDEAEIAKLTLAVATINAWNRIAVSFRSVPGSMDKQMGLDKAGLS